MNQTMPYLKYNNRKKNYLTLIPENNFKKLFLIENFIRSLVSFNPLIPGVRKNVIQT